MKALRLKSVLDEIDASQGELARATGLSRPAVNGLINSGMWPKRTKREALRKKITEFVKRRGGQITALFDVEKKKAPSRTHATRPVPANSKVTDEDSIMLLRKQSLTPDARRHFQLPRDPF